jgi:thiol-disulfide isomerase/thioredoxin
MNKSIVILLVLCSVVFVVTGCSRIVPGEGGNEVLQTLLVELYVAEGCPACTAVEPIFEKLANEYSRGEMILVEITPWGNYHTAETRQRFNWYALTPAGVPQMMFNGLSDYHVGKLDEATIRNKVEVQMAIEQGISLQASRDRIGTSTVFTGTVRNISNETLTNLVVNGMAFTDRGKTGFHYSVVDIFEDEKEIISLLAPDQEKEFTITVDELDWEGENLDGVIFVQSVDHEKKIIRQSVFLD